MPTQSSDKEKQRSTTLLVVAEHVLQSLVARYSCGKNERRWRFLILVLTALLLTFSIIPRQHFTSANLTAGTIATADIRATQDYLLEDRPLTESKRAEAETAAPNVYIYDAHAAADLVRSVDNALGLIWETKARGASTAADSLREAVSEAFGITISPAEMGSLARVKSDMTFSAEVSKLANRLYSRKVISDRKSFDRDRNHGILALDQETKLEVASGDISDYCELVEAREIVARARLSGGDPRDQEIRKAIIARLIKPNFIFDRELTEKRRQQARAAVRPVLFQVKRGEMIVRVGERVTEEEAQKLATIYETRHGVNLFFTSAGIFGLVLVVFYFPYRFARKNIRKFQPSHKDLFLLSTLSIATFLCLKFALVVSASMGGAFPAIESTTYYYLFPFAAGAILVRIILNSEVALVYCAICAPLFGIMFNNSLPVVIYSLVGGIIGAHGVRHCAKRGTIYSAGMKVSVVNVALALSFQIFNDSLFTSQTMYCALFALAGGFINAVVVMGTIPVLENIFQYTTDIKLLEMANLNAPVLRDLMVRAPGTYHHSVLVGNLVEAAAEAINANPLLARVAAYYHDIGKLSKPNYFIENVSGGENRHDKLSPSMSSLILISHVKEGVELAKEHRLGIPIIDIIRQSHGTGLITYFYQKAKNLAPEGKIVEESDFRYPGPKPQTREAGLVLLADCVEAASRTLTDPTPARIQGMVQKIINNIFIDGQLDECELTLKNLHEIAKSFNRVLTGIYHHRIDYPEPAYKEKITGGKKVTNDSDQQSTKVESDPVQGVKKGSGEDLKRLGISR